MAFETVEATPKLIGAAGGRWEISNRGANTVYYGGPTVTTSSYEGSIASGETLTLGEGAFFVSAGQSAIFSVPATAAYPPASVVDLRNFGPKTGTDITTPLKSAIASAASMKVPRVRIPDGSWTSTAQVLIETPGLILEGESEQGTVVTFSEALGAKAALKFGTAATNAQLRTITVKTAATATAAVAVATGLKAELTSVKAEGAIKGILGEGTAKVIANSCTATACVENGFKFNGTGSKAINCTANKNGTASVTNEGGFTAEGGTDIEFVNCTAEENATHGIYASKASRVRIVGGLCKLNGKVANEAGKNGRGITVGKETENCKIEGVTCLENYEAGIFVGEAGQGITNAQIANNFSLNNNKGERAGGHGIEYDGVGGSITSNLCNGNHNGISLNGSKTTVTGNTCEENKKTIAEPAVRGHGIQFNESGRHTFTGNICRKNAGRGLYGSASSAQGAVIVVGNESYENTEANIELSVKYEGSVKASNVEA